MFMPLSRRCRCPECRQGDALPVQLHGWPGCVQLNLLHDVTPRRVRCCMPGCNRTTAKPYSQWLCTAHWRLVPQAMKRAHNRIRRLEQKLDVKLDERGWRIWRRIKREIGAAAPLILHIEPADQETML